MDQPIEHFWKIRLDDMKEKLEANNFQVYLAASAAEAGDIVLKELLPKLAPESISWGGSLTMIACGLYEALNNDPQYAVIDTFDKSLSPADSYERRRQSLLVDVFITGTNALTESGQLVNLDMIGNRVGGITFGPKHVIVLVGRNKIVGDVTDAFYRVKNYCAPVNSMRLDKKTPCAKTSYCEECKSPERICNSWTITEKSFPKARIKVVLINEPLGF